MKHKYVMLFTILLFFSYNLIAQNDQSSAIIGNWTLINVDRNFKNSEISDEANYLFLDAYANHSLVTFNASKIDLFRHSKNVSYDYSITANELTIVFYSTDKSKKSITVYSYKIENNKLILTREDPILIEKYTFTR